MKADDVSVLQGRISTALDRISQGLVQLSHKSAPASEDLIAPLRAQIVSLNQAIDALRAQNSDLKNQISAAKRPLDADQTLQDELTALRAARRAEQSELEEIISALEPFARQADVTS